MGSKSIHWGLALSFALGASSPQLTWAVWRPRQQEEEKKPTYFSDHIRDVNPWKYKQRVKEAHEYLKNIVPPSFYGSKYDHSSKLSKRPEKLVSANKLLTELKGIRKALEELDKQIDDPFNVPVDLNDKISKLFIARRDALDAFGESIRVSMIGLGMTEKEADSVTSFLYRPDENDRRIYMQFESYNNDDLFKLKGKSLSAIVSEGFGMVVDEMEAYTGTSLPYRYQNIYSDLPKIRAATTKHRIDGNVAAYLQAGSTVSEEANRNRSKGRNALSEYLFWNGLSDLDASEVSSRFFDGTHNHQYFKIDPKAAKLVEPFEASVQRIRQEQDRNKPSSRLMQYALKNNANRKSTLTYNDKTPLYHEVELTRMREDLDATVKEAAQFISKAEPFAGEPEEAFEARLQGYQIRLGAKVKKYLSDILVDTLGDAAKRKHVFISAKEANELAFVELTGAISAKGFKQRDVANLTKRFHHLLYDPIVQKVLLAINDMQGYADRNTDWSLREQLKNKKIKGGGFLDGGTFDDRWARFVEQMDKASTAMSEIPPLWGEDAGDYASRTFPPMLRASALFARNKTIVDTMLEEIDVGMSVEEKTKRALAAGTHALMEKADVPMNRLVHKVMMPMFLEKGWEKQAERSRNAIGDAGDRLERGGYGYIKDIVDKFETQVTDAANAAFTDPEMTPPKALARVMNNLEQFVKKDVEKSIAGLVKNAVQYSQFNVDYRERFNRYREAAGVMLGKRGGAAVIIPIEEVTPEAQPGSATTNTAPELKNITGDLAADIKALVKAGQPFDGVLFRSEEKNTLNIDDDYLGALGHTIRNDTDFRGGFVADQAKLLLMHAAKIPAEEIATYLKRSPEVVALQIAAIEKGGEAEQYMNKILLPADEDIQNLAGHLMGTRTGKSQVLRMHFLNNWDVPQILTNTQLSQTEVMRYLAEIYDQGVNTAVAKVLN